MANYIRNLLLKENKMVFCEMLDKLAKKCKISLSVMGGRIMIKDNLIEVLHEMEEVTKLFKLDPFDIYIIGGGACILGEYTTRATLDIDFVDLGYPSKYGKVFVLLRDYDMLEYLKYNIISNLSRKSSKIRSIQIYQCIYSFKRRYCSKQNNKTCGERYRRFESNNT